MEVGLGEERGDLALGDGLSAGQCCGGRGRWRPGRQRGTGRVAWRGEREAADTGEAEHMVRI